MKIPPYSASSADDRTIFIILQRTKIGPFRGGSWCFGILDECDERENNTPTRLRAFRMDAKEVLGLIQRHMLLVTYRMTALGNATKKSRSFFVESQVYLVAFAWSEPISVRAGKRGLSIARA